MASKAAVEFRKPWGICRSNPFGADCICKFWRNISQDKTFCLALAVAGGSKFITDSLDLCLPSLQCQSYDRQGPRGLRTPNSLIYILYTYIGPDLMHSEL